VHLRTPQRGEKRDLSGSAERNAAETLQREHARWLADQGKTLAALEELARRSTCPGRPFRIECYDISNFQGSESVGSMVVFEDGKPRIRRVPAASGSGPSKGPNDVASHQEVPSAAGSGATKSGEEGQRGRSAAGRCRTWSSSTAVNRR
jgi:excinuclease ABC subunit C